MELPVNAAAAWDTAMRNLNVMDVTMLCLPVLIESITGPNWKDLFRQGDRKVLEKLLRRATVISLLFKNHRPHLHRVCGRAEWVLGRKRRALLRFEKAVRLAQEEGKDYQRARSLLDLAAVKEDCGGECRSEAIGVLKSMDSVLPRAESWLLGEDYDESVVAPPRASDDGFES